jgi:ABC-2 type transport system ATP-binding protein
MSAILEINSLVKQFTDVRAVDGISFNVEKGSITGLLGPNGAGKTTTIQMILDLITPTSGSISVFGMDMKHHREEILGQMNFSSPYVMLPSNLKVWENLYTFARLYGVKDIRGKIDELVDFFDIRELLPRKTASLSTGQLTRLNLTKALINDPKLLLLDEATASLDPDIADRTRKLLAKIRKEKGITMLYTTHNMEEVEELCDRVIFIQKGKIRDDGTPGELISKYGRKDLNEVFLHIAREHEGTSVAPGK